MTTLMKFVHIAAISVWAAGLMCLPFLYVQRAKVDVEHRLHNMHAMVRYFYVVLLSPAAFISIGSGIALIFLQQTFAAWFSAKMLFVGLMVMIHVVSGLVILRLFEEGETYGKPRYYAVTALTVGVVTMILFFVLGKPVLDPDRWATEVFAPGRLGEIAAPLISWMIP